MGIAVAKWRNGRVSRASKKPAGRSSGLLPLLMATLPLFAASGSARANYFTPVTPEYKLVFDEEFNGPSLRTDRWGANWLGCEGCVTPPVQPANELAAYDPDNVNVRYGRLRLNLAYDPVHVAGRKYKYRSGMVQSYGLKEFTYGYFEARIKMPISGKTNKIANWPAFWLNGRVWPTDGENDIAEALDGKACYHFHTSTEVRGKCARGNYTGWHVYGMLWEPEQVVYYYDGREVGRIKGRLTQSPMYLILNYGMSKIGGALRAPATMEVDYVHVYSKDSDAVAVEPDPGYGGPGDDASKLLYVHWMGR